MSKTETRSFVPRRFLRAPHVQTIVGKLWPSGPVPQFESLVEISLPKDQGRLAVVENRPPEWSETNGIVIMVHGLAGHARANYLRRLGRLVVHEKMLSARLNLRNCGEGFGLAKGLYHSGRSEDLRSVVAAYRSRYPNAPIAVVGFSLGANICLKFAGEEGSENPLNVSKVVAVCPPFNLLGTARRLEQGKNRIFMKFFLSELSRHLDRLRRLSPQEFPVLSFQARRSLLRFDDEVTAKLGGFTDYKDYYAKAQCGPFLEKISIPSLVIYSSDDPIVDSKSLEDFNPSAAIRFERTDLGGHLGFIDTIFPAQGLRWMDRVVFDFLKERLSRGTKMAPKKAPAPAHVKVPAQSNSSKTKKRRPVWARKEPRSIDL